MKPTRLFDLSEYQYHQRPLDISLAYKENGEWKSYSSKEFFETSQMLALGLLAEGFKPGDRIANISNNRPEWNFADKGMLSMGAIHVPIYPTISDDDYKFILRDAGVSGVFVSNQDLFNRLIPIKNEINPDIKFYLRFCWDVSLQAATATAQGYKDSEKYCCGGWKGDMC